MITATIAALSIGLTAGTFDATPPARPSGSIPVGSGMELLDRSFNSTPAPKADPSLPGGRRATMRYVWWSVYVKATGNVEMRTSLTCTHLNENPGNHKHGPQCKIGACASECPYDGHKTTLTTTSSSSRSRAVSQAISRAQSSVRSITAKVGASSFGVSSEVSGTASQSSSSSVTLGSSISSAVGRSVSGSVEISLGHFNSNPCTSETWWFGTKEYEIRMIIQVFEQDYYAESWVTGGTHGVLPSSGLKLAGAARFVGAAQDVQLGTYQVPSNQPVKKQSDLNCGCKPRATLTEDPYGNKDSSGGTGTTGTKKTKGSTGTQDTRSHNSLPSGTTRFTVTPQEDERVFFTNPTNETLVLAYADFTVEVEPGEEKEIDRGDVDGPIAIDILKTNGERVMRVVYGANLEDGKSQADIWEESFAEYENEVGTQGKAKGNVEMTWKVEEGEKSLPLPEMADEVVAPQIPQPMTLIEIMISPTMSTNSVPVMNGSTPVLEIRGDIPDDATFAIESGETQTAGDIFLKIKGIDGETRAAFVKFADVKGESLSHVPQAVLVCRKADGEIIGELDITFSEAAIRMSMTPESGPAGSSATLIIDTRDVIAYMAQSSGAHTEQFDILLDFSGGGGATGPVRVQMDPSGITRIQVRRGSVPGGFQVAVSLEPRQNGGHELGHALDDSNGNSGVKSDPGFGITKGG